MECYLTDKKGTRNNRRNEQNIKKKWNQKNRKESHQTKWGMQSILFRGASDIESEGRNTNNNDDKPRNKNKKLWGDTTKNNIAA